MYKIIFLIFTCLYLVGCQNSTKESGNFDSNIKKIIKNHDSIFVDSIVKSTNVNSFIFLNYPNFISEKVYQKIKEQNIKVGKLNTEGIYSGFFVDEFIKFDIEPNFENDKLISITLDVIRKDESLSSLGHFTISETLFDNIKKTFDLKYGKPETKFDKFISEWHNQGGKTSRNTGFYDYKYSNENKIILLHVQSYECRLPIKEESCYNFYDFLSFKYYTLDSYNYINNREKEIEKTKKKIQQLKTEKTMKDM
jgi:hypothetical protein